MLTDVGVASEASGSTRDWKEANYEKIPEFSTPKPVYWSFLSGVFAGIIYEAE